LQIREENILKSLGVPQEEADGYLKDQIQQFTRQCLDICTPAACYSFIPEPHFSSPSGVMTLKGTDFHLGKMVSTALKMSSEIALFIATCGHRVELLSKQLMKEGHSLEGLIVDLIGSEIAEGATEKVHRQIEEVAASHGFHSTNRYSPGYCNWPVSDQQQLFALLEDNHCGVRLTASSLMVPIKSVSGIIGIGKRVTNRGYACAQCPAEHCIYRDKYQK
jgi:hypothetical protein